MLETSARLLRLLALLQSRRFWGGPELAQRLEVTDRTLRRDIDKLRQLGYPVDASSGVAGGYQLGAGASLPPLLLEDDEALAVSIGLRTAAASTVAGIEHAAVRALVKLERVLPERLRQRANALRDAISILEPSGPAIAPDTLAALASACSDHLQARFRYAARDAEKHTAPSAPGADDSGASGEDDGQSSKALTERVVEPAGMVHTGYRWYLVAWDVTRADWRTFRVDRVLGAVALGQRFAPRQPPEGGDLRKYVVRGVSVEVHEHRARVLLFAPMAVISQRMPPTVGVLEPDGEDRCVLSTGARSLDSLAYWITLFGADFQVLEPPELVQRLREQHARLSQALSRQSG